MPEELTSEQMNRQDLVDNACYKLLIQLNPRGDTHDWDIAEISDVREAVRRVLEKHGIPESEFYPYLETENN